MKIAFKNFIYESIEITETPAFKAWFGNSKVVDDDGEPLKVYHGTTGNFDTFDIKKVYHASYVGKGFYFTSNPHDANSNYASGVGADTNIKIANVSENWNNIEDFDELSNAIGVPVDEIEKADSEGKLYQLLQNKARDLIIGENPAPNIMPVYLKIENPFYVGDKFKQYFDYIIPFDEESEEYGEPEGDAVPLMNAFEYELDELEYINRDEMLSKFTEEINLYDGGFYSTEFFKAIQDSEGLIDACYGGSQNYIGEFIKRIILRAGFDGIIMDASVFKMEGTRGTNHYIVYQPNQIKSIFNKNPTQDANITKE